MTGVSILSGVAQSNLFAIQRSQNTVSQITERLTTGRDVNSILDNPTNFLASREQLQSANQLSGVLDNIVRSVLTIQAASDAIEGITSLLNQASTVTSESRTNFLNGTSDPNSINITSGNTLQDFILADNPVAYFRLDGNAENSGTGGSALDGTLANGGPAFNGEELYTNQAGASAQFNGNEGIRVPDSALINTATYPERTVELIFNADDVSGRQVLFEEGGGTNSLAIYIDNGTLYATGRDSGTGGPFSASATIEAGQTYHAAFTFDFPGTGTFEGFLNGQSIGSAAVTRNFPAHGGDIGIGYSPDSAYYFDGPQTASNFFNGRITDVAIYNDVLTQSDLQERTQALAATLLNQAYEEITTQINQLAADASYLGTNLLAGDSITTAFNPQRTSTLVTEGFAINQNSLGLASGQYETIEDLNNIIDRVQDAVNTVESLTRSLDLDFGILNTRASFTEGNINTLRAGSDDLTLADLDEEGAKLLAATTQLILAQETLSSTTRSKSESVLSFFSNSNQSVINLFA